MPHLGRVSCRHVRWLFDVCRRRRIPERHLLNHVPVSRDEILDPGAMIDWDLIALIYANFGSWMSSDELIEEGASAWKHTDFKAWLMTAALFPDPGDQIMSALASETGILSTLPMRARISKPDSDHLVVDIETESQVPTSLVFLRVLAGELASLPARLGSKAAEVHVVQTSTGARIEFALFRPGLFAGLRRALVLPLQVLTMKRHFRQLFDLLLVRERALVETGENRQEAVNTARRLRDELDSTRAELAAVREEYDNLMLEATRHQSDLESLLTTISEAVVKTDEHGRIIEFNDTTANMFGFGEDFLRGASITTLMPDAESARTTRRALSLSGTTRRGDELQLQVTALPSAFGRTTWTIRDMTRLDQADKERAQLQHQLQAAQRVESLGELTGGIAHDFNNLLVAINGYAELGLEMPALDETIKDYLEEIRGAGERAADMTQNLLTFARQQDMKTSEVDLNGMIRGVERIIRRLLPVNIDVRFLQSLQSPFVMADPGQLEQVVINLCVNARDAMPSGGVLTIAVGQQDAVEPDGSTTEVALITIEDTGTGIPADVANRIFEPFFTTKDKGEGTGLGLSVVFGIIKQHGGTIDVDSEAGRGTRFQIALPLADPLAQKGVTSERERAPVLTSGVETILFIEDNAQVSQLCERVLKARGYNVITAADGAGGVRAFHRDADQIDLVIADIVMPRLGGYEVMREIRGIRPDIKMLFSTGYSRDSDQARFIDEHGLDIVQKPYTPETLCEAVRRVLDEDRAPS
ncbi:MAG: ATP-binding protein [Gammaproteobacteria bacterium]|nr:ATP-binding protein [Gammaproteobacteria bacterium]